MLVYMLLIAAAVLTASAKELPRQDYSENHVLEFGSKPMFYCGRLLLQTFELVCKDSYLNDLSENEQLQADEPKHERARRSLAEVCCEKPCLLHELQEYCP